MSHFIIVQPVSNGSGQTGKPGLRMDEMLDAGGNHTTCFRFPVGADTVPGTGKKPFMA